MKNKKIKKIYVLALIVTCLLCVLFAGCEEKDVKASFVRFSIGERASNEYYLDFTVKFDNETNQTKLIESDDFYIEINGEENKTVSFWYEYQDTFYAYPSVEGNETLTLRVRVIAQVNMGERNKILVKYKDSTLVDDDVYFSNIKQGQ